MRGLQQPLISCFLNIHIKTHTDRHTYTYTCLSVSLCLTKKLSRDLRATETKRWAAENGSHFLSVVLWQNDWV